MNQTDRTTPATLAEQTDTLAAQLCDQLHADGMTPTLAARVATWAAAGGGYNRQEMTDRAAYFVRLIVERIANARHPRTQAEAFRIAFGFHRNASDSVRAIARRLRVSQPGLCKQANAIRAELHLPKGNAFSGAGRSGAPAVNGKQARQETNRKTVKTWAGSVMADPYGNNGKQVGAGVGGGGVGRQSSSGATKDSGNGWSDGGQSGGGSVQGTP